MGAALLSSLGANAMDDVFDRLHFLSPATTVAPVAIAAAIIVEESFSPAGIKSLIVAVLMVVTGPVLTHATARAARVRQFGHWKTVEGERVD